MEPEKGPLEKETPLQTIHFGFQVSLWGLPLLLGPRWVDPMYGNSEEDLPRKRPFILWVGHIS